MEMAARRPPFLQDGPPQALRTLPALRQEVQTLIFLVTPSTTTRADWRLGFQECFVWRREWLTL